MPLWKTPTKRSFKHNVRVETEAGKRRGLSKAKARQRALAIAYNIKSKAKRGKRK